MGCWSKEEKGFDEMTKCRAVNLFKCICTNDKHVLHQLLPELRCVKYELRNINHGRVLPVMSTSHDNKNFIVRMIYNL